MTYTDEVLDKMDVIEKKYEDGKLTTLGVLYELRRLEIQVLLQILEKLGE